MQVLNYVKGGEAQPRKENPCIAKGRRKERERSAKITSADNGWFLAVGHKVTVFIACGGQLSPNLWQLKLASQAKTDGEDT